MNKTLAGALVAGVLASFAGSVALAAPASADEPAVCYAYVHPHVYPRPILPPYGIGVETGEYHIHQNCISVGGTLQGDS